MSTSNFEYIYLGYKELWASGILLCHCFVKLSGSADDIKSIGAILHIIYDYWLPNVWN